MSTDPYRDPVLYDLEYAGHIKDIAWYRSLVAGLGGPVLELGVGSGRIALPLLDDGHELVGVDISKAMLDALRQRMKPGHRCALHQVDFKTLALGRTFPVVLLPFNAIHHCADADAVRQLFRVVRAHLGPSGVFGMDCYLPDPDLYDRDPGERYEPRIFRRPDNGQTLTSWEQSWYDKGEAVHHVRYIYKDAEGVEEVVQLDLKMWTHAELHDLLAEAGFRVLHEMSDFDGTPMGQGALQSVLVLTADS